MSKERRKKYLRLREIRKERDYQSGTLQFANRPYTFPSARVPSKRKFTTTKSFIEKHSLKV